MVGEKIGRYLKERGISQTHLARKTGISVQKLNSRLSGKSELKAEELYRIGQALGVALETFREVG